MTKQFIRRNLILRIVFFLIYFIMTLNIVSVDGWTFISILFALFATRDLVQAVRVGKFYFDTKNNKLKQNNQEK